MKQPLHSHGFALPTLMMMLAVASLAALLALRNLWVNERMLNAESDQLRTQYKAEATLPVALADIVGSPGTTTANVSTPNLRHTLGEASQMHAFFPSSLAEYDLLRQRLGASDCNAGICAPNALDANASTASYWRTKTSTAFNVTAVDTPYGNNTAWYWVDIFPQANHSAFVYRITVLANGVMPGSTTVVQAIWARDTPTASTGQWRSWHVLHD